MFSNPKLDLNVGWVVRVSVAEKGQETQLYQIFGLLPTGGAALNPTYVETLSV
ncbi:hypothetical protein [Nodularia sphaerocarpa]|uniref:hypothetical protein n=1 Tax=Nodularia sphaerocarpa TaxID=137816 RepID=UPI001EFBF956|nr:hypothetical protein [Nodularia sphaerocarpa]MDB9375353.1 hypothetical protein [Nodularia sphaerocarpa CS-585]MDB9380195.1 hypothetical protein [Nodularia sphaerocarpa CS-585A2]ULP71724.1 hypothetical protein BDGGKGIB_01357 [Nodularia sphaerocarpa UHCC 0038]